MKFRVLGPLEIDNGGAPLHLGTPLQRRLLGLLILRAGETVTYERLAEDLWEANPPGTARHTLQGYVHRLRGALGTAAGRLETRPGGYHLKLSSGELDSQTFEDLAGSGRRALVRGDAVSAGSVLEEALRLWRGAPFEGLGDLVAFETERARLGALRMTAVEDHVDAELALGHHIRVIAHVEALLFEHPFRERLWGQLMIARYRTGRQAEALEAFRRARDVLDGELGIQPGRWLCRLQEQILLQDPSLDAPDPELARGELRECLQIGLELGDRLGVAMDLDRLGQIAVLLDEPDAGCVLAGAADRLRERVGETITPEAFRWQQDRAPALARKVLNVTEVERAVARGHALSLEEAAAIAGD